MKKITLILAIITALVFTSCEKEEFICDHVCDTDTVSNLRVQEDTSTNDNISETAYHDYKLMQIRLENEKYDSIYAHTVYFDDYYIGHDSINYKDVSIAVNFQEEDYQYALNSNYNLQKPFDYETDSDVVDSYEYYDYGIQGVRTTYTIRIVMIYKYATIDQKELWQKLVYGNLKEKI